MTTEPAMESVEAFTERARAWVTDNLPPRGDESLSERELQAPLFDAGFAGIAMPNKYGGAGLTLRHQQAFYDVAAAGYRVPTLFSVSIAILGVTLLDTADEVLKRRHLPRILRGEERWIQLLSEPSGGSDMAAALTKLERDGDDWILNGAKMWSTAAMAADWGMCLARTDFSVPKHSGLTMVCVPLKNTTGVTIQPIRHANGVQAEFCQEFFDDVRLPGDHVIGAVNEGWNVAKVLIAHERLAAGGAGHGYGLTARSEGGGGARTADPAVLVKAAQQRRSTVGLRHKIADAYIERRVSKLANERIATGIRIGALEPGWGSIVKLHIGMNSPRESKIALAVHGCDGVVWDGDEPIAGNAGEDWVISRGPALGGGSNEMQRNLLAERLLGLPREQALDTGVPFADVLRNRRENK
ncbi:acyl-CoA dehydrogenase family protein [Mycolicibacterium moriokaense]|uniref:Alkylation response protein AidB-like acyl-CoA dehydrogenase n=1 Tax=Mycolicibacterium moriokaense TaxID=39691 RepID=A0A318H8T6_9MYCO|nr:acyl-CoA dehydrogenase family protein [Mycolicibacterium moriokaense]PXX01654.1 alkylation response protein AidB-like acyl-CoA dehydrogenase [Mycolicibacterium moriokaense]